MSFFILDSGLQGSKVDWLRHCAVLAWVAGGARGWQSNGNVLCRQSALHQIASLSTHGLRSFGLSMRFISANFLVFFCLPMPAVLASCQTSGYQLPRLNLSGVRCRYKG